MTKITKLKTNTGYNLIKNKIKLYFYKIKKNTETDNRKFTMKSIAFIALIATTNTDTITKSDQINKQIKNGR